MRTRRQESAADVAPRFWHAPGAPAVLVRLSAPPPLPLLPGDLITLTGTVRKTTGQPATILADAVQVAGVAD